MSADGCGWDAALFYLYVIIECLSVTFDDWQAQEPIPLFGMIRISAYPDDGRSVFHFLEDYRNGVSRWANQRTKRFHALLFMYSSRESRVLSNLSFSNMSISS